ncbi:MAG TPA: MBL fold metallo-hydrolase [Cyclobacteriaceae bacterium]|nr:MBL fold metallo-hydrolase [Cyclobacteriaceae bacterium]
MSLFISSLNSGSNGNCYYVGNQHEAVLIDGGISRRETEKRMRRVGISMKKVKAIFISHEHGDHVHGIPSLAKKHQLCVYASETTWRSGNIGLNDARIERFKAYEPVKIGNLSITAFPKLHDACDPHSFIVSSDSVTVGIFTDIGAPCQHVVNHFRQCHAAFLESNYDEELLINGSYPAHLKQRIRGGKGHLSNTQAAELFVKHKPPFMSHLFLSHLSQENNRPAIVQKLFRRIAGGTSIVIASRERETPLYHISNSLNPRPSSRNISPALQLELFN